MIVEQFERCKSYATTVPLTVLTATSNAVPDAFNIVKDIDALGELSD